MATWHWMRQMTPIVTATMSITVTIVICKDVTFLEVDPFPAQSCSPCAGNERSRRRQKTTKKTTKQQLKKQLKTA
jgi:hypothetical protein